MVEKVPATGDPKILHELGRMVVLFQDLETGIGEGIHWLLFPDDAGQPEPPRGDDIAVLLANLSFRQRVDVFFSLLQVRSAKETPRARDLRLAIGKAEEHRNTFLHSRWYLPPRVAVGERFKASARAKTGLRSASVTVTLAELIEINQHIHNADVDLFSFLVEVIYPGDFSSTA